jgi:hypothetical protein
MTTFAELSNDVIRIICTYLDIESHISLYLATEFPATADQLTQKMQAANQTDLIYFVAMLPPHYQASLTRLFGGTIPFDFQLKKHSKTLQSLFPLLVDHQQLFELKGKKVAAKRNHKKYGALRLKPTAQDYLENLVIQTVINKTHRMDEFIDMAFDINVSGAVAVWKASYPTCALPNCFRDPVRILDKFVEQCPKEMLFDECRAFALDGPLDGSDKENWKEAQERVNIVKERLIYHVLRLPWSPWHYRDADGPKRHPNSHACKVAHLICPGEPAKEAEPDEEVFVGRKSYVYE